MVVVRATAGEPDVAGSVEKHRNDVSVVGRLAAEAEPRELPSGDRVVTWRLVVERDGPPITGKPHLDTLQCAAWTVKLQRSALSWRPGDTIEVHGALRRRFWRAGPALNSRYEIETVTAKRIAKSAQPTPT